MERYDNVPCSLGLPLLGGFCSKNLPLLGDLHFEEKSYKIYLLWGNLPKKCCVILEILEKTDILA